MQLTIKYCSFIVELLKFALQMQKLTFAKLASTLLYLKLFAKHLVKLKKSDALLDVFELHHAPFLQ